MVVASHSEGEKGGQRNPHGQAEGTKTCERRQLRTRGPSKPSTGAETATRQPKAKMDPKQAKERAEQHEHQQSHRERLSAQAAA